MTIIFQKMKTCRKVSQLREIQLEDTPSHVKNKLILCFLIRKNIIHFFFLFLPILVNSTNTELSPNMCILLSLPIARQMANCIVYLSKIIAYNC